MKKGGCRIADTAWKMQKKGGAPASANAIRENELKRAFQRELELERLQHESAIAKLQSVIERLHQACP